MMLANVNNLLHYPQYLPPTTDERVFLQKYTLNIKVREGVGENGILKDVRNGSCDITKSIKGIDKYSPIYFTRNIPNK